MSTQTPSPLSTPDPWNLVAGGYAAELLPMFEHYSREALRLAELPPAPRIADVACGPGTLSLLAATDPAIRARVDALDFSEAMLARFRRRLAESGATGVEIREGDGQKLPWPDDTFDGAFSMFGLIFFPDRGAGLRELRRVLKPGARAVVSSWAPLAGPFGTVIEAIGALMPELPFGKGKAPLGDPDEFTEEMRAAGFRDVRIHTARHSTGFPALSEFWEGVQRTAAPLVLLRKNLGEKRWKDVSAGVYAHLEKTLGEGPVDSTGQAWLGVGVK